MNYRINCTINTNSPFLTLLDQEIQFETLGVGIHSIAGALKNFFKNLSEPLIPVTLYDELYKCAGIVKVKC